MRYTVGAPSSVQIATLQDIKDNLRITHDHQDSLLCTLNDTAHAVIEEYTGTSLSLREVTVRGESFLQDMVFRYAPIHGEVVIKYLDQDKVTQTLDPDLYKIVINSAGYSELFFIDENDLPEVYDSEVSVIITYTTGYTERSAPAQFKQFVLLYTGKLYEVPVDSAHKYRSFAKSLLFPFKRQVTDVGRQREF